MSVETMLAAALDYAGRGWPVFPCSPKSKKPLVPSEKDEAGNKIRGTGGLCKATCEPETIIAWWSKWPKALIGVATGRSGFFVIDFDPRIDPDTGEEWTLDRLKNELEAQIGCSLPLSRAVRTPSGGIHLYLKQPVGGVRNRDNLPDHVDVRGDGGYVIVPPGTIANYGSYRWLRDAADAPIADAPSALVSILREKRKSASKAGGKPQSGSAGEGVERYVLSALARECEIVRTAPTGARQPALNRAAFSIAQLVGAGGIGAERARSAIAAAAHANPGRDEPEQIEATIDSGWAAGLASPRDMSTVAPSMGHARPFERARPATANDNPPLQVCDNDALNRRLSMIPMTDLGNAERFAARFGDRIRYVDKIGWMAYDGRRFILDGAEAMIGGWVHETVRGIRDEARAMRESGRRDYGENGALDDLLETKRNGDEVLLSDKLAAWAKASESSNRLSCIAGIAKNLTGAGMTVQPEWLDRNPFLINVANGTLELHHGVGDEGRWGFLKLRPHSPADLITRIAPYNYDQAAHCPLYDAFLARVQPAEDMRRFLHQWGGLSLTGDVSEQS